MEISLRIWDFRSSPSCWEGSQASPRVIYGSNVHSQCCVSASLPSNLPLWSLPSPHFSFSPVSPNDAAHLSLVLPSQSELPQAELGLLSTPFWAEPSLAAERSEGGEVLMRSSPCPAPPLPWSRESCPEALGGKGGEGAWRLRFLSPVQWQDQL